MAFNYYYGKELEKFTFIRIPKIILTGELFSVLSLQAKLLYGVLLDRMSLSMKNGWTDREGVNLPQMEFAQTKGLMLEAQ